jgi:hypothetical protein
MKTPLFDLDKISRPEYGHCMEQPIKVYDIATELEFMERIIHESGECLIYHRLGSRTGKNIKLTDIYEVVTSDGKHHDYLFFYFLDNEKELPTPPKNYRFLTKADNNHYLERFIENEDNPELKDLMIASVGTNSRDKNFPFGVLSKYADFPEWINENKAALTNLFKTI